MGIKFDFSSLPDTDASWGPSDDVPESMKFHDVPYAPFSKTDKLGKAADWQQTKEEDMPRRFQERRRDQYHAYGASAAKMFGAEHEEEDFSIVDNNSQPVRKQAVLRGRRGGKQDGTRSNSGWGRQGNGRDNRGARGGFRNGRGGRNAGGNNNGGRNGWNNNGGNNRWGNNRWGNNRWGNNRWGNNRWGNRWGNRYYNREEQNKNRAPSVKVEDNWKLVTEIELNKLTKLNLVVPKPEEVSSHGILNVYNKKYELFRPEMLKQEKKSIVNPTTCDDPVVKKMASENKAAIFATDSVLAQLMCAIRSAYSWDIIVTKKNGVIYFDRRNGTDKLEVDENAQWPPTDANKDSIDSSSNLSLEATYINHNFVANSLMSSVHELQHPENPFGSQAETSEPLLNRGYKYVKYSLPTGDDEHPLNVVVRSQIDAYQPEGKLVSINALNQYNPKPADDWKTKLVSGSRGVIFAGELKKNNNKIARWTAKAMLGGLDAMKIGFVSRKVATDNTKHVVVGALTFAPPVLSAQIRFSLGNGWGIIKSLIDIIDHEGGDDDYRFVVFRAPGISKVSIYQVPLTTFDEEL